MSKIDEKLAEYIIENRENEDIREEILQQHGIILQDIQTSSKDDELLVNKYPNIFTIKYQDNYISSLPTNVNYVLFDMSQGLLYQDQLVKYNFNHLNGSETTRPIQLYEHLMIKKHFNPKIVNVNNTTNANTTGANGDQEYFVILQYSSSIYRQSLFPQKLSFIMSPILSKKLFRTDILTINSLKQENQNKYQYTSFTEDTSKRDFNTPLNRILQQHLRSIEENDYLMQRQWYNIGLMLEKVEKEKMKQ